MIKMFKISNFKKGYLKYAVVCFFILVCFLYIEIYSSTTLCDGIYTNFTEGKARTLDHNTRPKIERFFVDKYILLEKSFAMKGHFKGSSFNESRYVQVDGLSEFVELVRPVLLRDEKLKGILRENDTHFRDERIVTDVDCRELIKGRTGVPYSEETGGLDWFETTIQIGPRSYINMTRNCTEFKNRRGYIMDHLTDLEKNFPVAFSILVYRDVEQAERLIRAIYRPQNVYCIHVDSKSGEDIFSAMSHIADCFDNVFLASRRFDIKWGRLSVLTAELLCMKELLERSKTWKYFINLTGQEFPLRTNYELVKILKAYNGANDVQSTVYRANKYRWRWAGSPPYNITPVKGSVHIVVQRGFVDYVIHDPRAKDVLTWARKTFVPDETFFATLNHNPVLQMPGSYTGLPETTLSSDPEKPFMARFKIWGDYLSNWPCHGERVHGLCVFGIGDLPLLVSRRELFANKFYLDYQPHALDCLGEWHYNNTRDEYRGSRDFDVRWYSQLGFVKNKVD